MFDSLRHRSPSSVVLLTGIYDIIRRKIMLLQPHRIWVSKPYPYLQTRLSLCPSVISLALQAAKICLIVRKTRSLHCAPLATPELKYLSKSN